MSDPPVTEGWWQASDGKYYPPAQHPAYFPPPATFRVTSAPGSGGASDVVPAPSSVRGLSTAILVMFIISAVCAGLSALTSMAFASRLDDARSGRSFRSGTVFLDLNDGYDQFMIGLGLMSWMAVAMMVLLIIWTRRCHRNLDTWGVGGARLGHGMTIASWFIPVFWYIGPYLCISDGYRGADPELAAGESLRTRPGSRVALFWWALSCVANVVLVVGFFIVASVTTSEAEANETLNLAADPDTAYGGAITVAIGSVILLIAAVLGAVAIRRLGTRQERRAELWFRNMAAPPNHHRAGPRSLAMSGDPAPAPEQVEPASERATGSRDPEP